MRLRQSLVCRPSLQVNLIAAREEFLAFDFALLKVCLPLVYGVFLRVDESRGLKSSSAIHIHVGVEFVPEVYLN